MPKISKIGKFRKTAAAAQASSVATEEQLQERAPEIDVTAADDTNKPPPPEQLSRGQRKRQAKREQYLKREKLILSTLKLKRKEEQSKRIDGLDALREALLSTSSSAEKTSDSVKSSQHHNVSSNKAKKSLAAREVTHMNLVMEHPDFQTNPFATMQEHLRNTLAEQRESLQEQSKQRHRQEQQEAVLKKQRQKEKRQAAGGKHRKKFHATRRTGKSR